MSNKVYWFATRYGYTIEVRKPVKDDDFLGELIADARYRSAVYEKTNEKHHDLGEKAAFALAKKYKISKENVHYDFQGQFDEQDLFSGFKEEA